MTTQSCHSELPAVRAWSYAVSGGGVYREANRAVSAAGAWKMTRKATWCAGSAIGFKSDVQPPFVKLYLSTFYPHVRRDLSYCTGGVSSVLLLINGLTSKLPEADNRHLSFKECSRETFFALTFYCCEIAGPQLLPSP